LHKTLIVTAAVFSTYYFFMTTSALPLVPELWKHEIVGRHLAACRYYTRAALRCTSRAFAALVPRRHYAPESDEWCELLPVCSVARVVAWAGKDGVCVAMRAAIRLDDWDKFQQLNLSYEYGSKPFFSPFLPWTRSETWSLRFFECDRVLHLDSALCTWFRESLNHGQPRVFSRVVQLIHEHHRGQKPPYICSRFSLNNVRSCTLAPWQHLSVDYVRQHYSDEIIREKQRGLDEFIHPYLSLLDVMTDDDYFATARVYLTQVCVDHAEVERHLFPELQ
jgi:hypothetical protein